MQPTVMKPAQSEQNGPIIKDEGFKPDKATRATQIFKLMTTARKSNRIDKKMKPEDKIKILNRELEMSSDYKSQNRASNKLSALKARMKKTSEKEYMRALNVIQLERFKEFNDMLPDKLHLDLFENEKTDDKTREQE